MYEFKVTLDDEDYILFNQYHLLNSSAGKKSLLFHRLTFPAISLLAIVIFILAEADQQLILSEAIMLIIVSVFFIIFSKKRILRSMKKRIIKMKKDGRLPYHDEAVFKFDEENMYEIASMSENVTNYALIEKIAITDGAIYIYINSLSAYIIPVSVFATEAEKSEFLEFISSKVNSYKM